MAYTPTDKLTEIRNKALQRHQGEPFSWTRTILEITFIGAFMALMFWLGGM